jgi:ceramide glucosyltransferase
MSGVFAILAAIGLGVLLASRVLTAAAAMYWARRRPRGESAGNGAEVSILIPLKGTDAELGANLAAFARQDYPEFEIVLVLADPRDPAMAEARQCVTAFPGRVRIVTGPDLMRSANPKTNTLARAYAAARHPLIMHCDANLRLEPQSLRHAAGMLGPKVGLVTTYFVGVRPSGFSGEIECAFLNGYARFLASAAVLGHAPVIGKLMLYRRADLERAGGYARLAENAAHDTAMDRAIRGIGLRVRALPGFLRQPVGRRAWPEVWQRQVRWCLVRRINQPLAYAGEIVSGPIAACVCAGVAAAFGGLAPMWSIAGTAAFWYAVEGVASAAARWHMTAASPAAWLLRDALMPAMWLTALFSRHARWRGSSISIARSARRGEAAGMDG